MKAEAIAVLILCGTLPLCGAYDPTPREGSEQTPITDSTVSQPDDSQMKHELKNLENMTGNTRIKHYEEKISRNMAFFSDGTMFPSDTVKVTVYKISLLARISSQKQQLHIGAKTSRTRLPLNYIEFPLEKIRRRISNETTISSRSSELIAVVAEWKMSDGLPSNTTFELPQNASLFTVSYYRKSRITPNDYVYEGFPVSYEMDLTDDFTEISQASSRQILLNVTRRCMWLNLTSTKWESTGCRTTFDTPRRVRCECNHTTTFAVLLSVTKTEGIPLTVSTISYGFEGASIVALAVTIVFLLTARYRVGIDSAQARGSTGMRSNRTNSQISMCACLLCLHVAALSSDLARHGSENACFAATALTHFFLLASACWSFNEGLSIFIKTVPKLTMAIQFRRLTIIQLFIGWIVPVFITAVCLIYGIANGQYMDKSEEHRIVANKTGTDSDHTKATPKYDRCWLSIKLSMGAFAPIVVIIVLNLAVLCYITAVVIRMNRKVSLYQATSSNNSEEASVVSGVSATPLAVDVATKKRNFLRSVVAGVRTFAILIPILSVVWVFGLLANVPTASTAMMSIHSLVNSLQGLFIFLLYCVFGKRDWERVKRKWKNSDIRYMMQRFQNKRESVATIRHQTPTYGTHAFTPKIDVNRHSGSPT